MSWLTLLPPILAIIIAIWKRQVILALLVAIFSAEMILFSANPVSAFVGSVERVVDVFSSGYSTQVLIFSLLIGALIQLIKTSGGVGALVEWLSRKNYITNQRRAGILPTVIGSSIFIDTNMSVLSAGLPAQSLFDKFKMSRARLAYIIDSTCAPISVLILLNGWGAAILADVVETGVAEPNSIVINSIAYNFYPILTLLVVFYTVYSCKVYGPMRRVEQLQAKQNIQTTHSETDSATNQETLVATKKRYMLLPMVFMVVSILVFMFITGDGDLRNGAGAKSVLWSVSLSIVLAMLLLRFDGKRKSEELFEQAFIGMGKLLPLVTLVLLAFALAGSMAELKTGLYVSQIVGAHLALWSIPALVFLIAGFMAFTTGTSWGTFGILIPIVIPIATSLGIDPSLLLAAVLGGAVFGDHASPISDTTVISSLAAGCDHLEHVKTQLPYALFTGGLTTIIYLLLGIFYI